MALVGNISGSSRQSSRIGVTGSVVFAGADPDYASAFPAMGSDVAFYVSGNVGGTNSTTEQSVAVFGGDTIISGALFVNRASEGVGSHLTVTTDGKVGIGTDTPAYKLSVGGNMDLGEYLYHKNDSDTFIRFQSDSIKINAGNVDMLSITEDGTQDKIVFNEGGVDVDFRVESKDKDNALFVDGGKNQVFILSAGDGAGGGDEANASDITFFVSGSKLDYQQSAPYAQLGGKDKEGTSVFGGDMVFSGTSYGGVRNRYLGSNSKGMVLEDVSDVRRFVNIFSVGEFSTPADVNFHVSGSASSKGGSTRGTALFEGDLHISGNLTVDGSTPGGGGGAPTDAQYVTLATDGDLSAERVLTAGSGISITDGGAGSSVTIAATGGGGGGEYTTTSTYTLNYGDFTSASGGFTFNAASSGSQALPQNSQLVRINWKVVEPFEYDSFGSTQYLTSIALINVDQNSFAPYGAYGYESWGTNYTSRVNTEIFGVNGATNVYLGCGPNLIITGSGIVPGIQWVSFASYAGKGTGELEGGKIELSFTYLETS